MDPQSVDRGPFSFFWLPAGVRRLVYRHLLYAQGDVINQERQSRNGDEIDPFYEKTSVHTDILRSCWTIYYEAIGVLYGDNTFRWNPLDQLNISDVMPTLRGGVKTQDLHRNIQLKIDIIRLGWPDIDHHNFLLRLTGSTVCRDVLQVYFGTDRLSGDLSTERVEPPSHLTSPILQAIRQISGFKKVIILLSPRRTGIGRRRRMARPAEYIWSEALTRELESGWGPNLSKHGARLEFKPRDLPQCWAREHVSPLLRLSEVDRQNIIRLIIGQRPMFYPSTLPEGGELAISSSWLVLPQLKTANPHLDLSILYTCRKLWEESWGTIIEHKHLVFNFDFAVPTTVFDSGDLNIRYLRNVHIKLKNLEKPSQLRDEPWHFRHLVPELWYLAQGMRYTDSLSRESLIIELDIAKPNWQIGRESEPGSGRLNSGNPWWLHKRSKKGDENLGITKISGLDLIVANLLGGLHIWNRMDIALSHRTLKNRYWRPSATEVLEKYLGPNLSKDKRRLAFRPQYFARLWEVRNVGAKTRNLESLHAFMRKRKDFSSNPLRDLAEAEDGWTDAVPEEDEVDAAEPIVFSKNEGADGEEGDGDGSDVDSDAISIGAERAIAAVGELLWMEERGMFASRSSSPMSLDLETSSGEDSDDDEEGYSDGGHRPGLYGLYDLDF